MKPKSTLRSFLALASSSLLTMSSAHATSLYWSADGATQGGAGAATWNTSTSNWGAAASGPFSSAWNNGGNDTAIFGGATAGAVPLAEPITVGGLQFDTAGYTISSDTLTFGAAGNIAVNTAVNTGVTISSIVAGSVAVQKTGTGDLTLSGNNTYTGVLTLNGGRTFANTSVNALGTGAASLTLASGTLVFNHSANLNFARSTTVTGDFQIDSSRNAAGAGLSYTLGTLGIGANTLSIGAGVTTSGTAAVTFGATTLSGNATFNVINGAGSTGQLTLGLLGDGGSSFGITKTGAGNLILASANTYSGPTIISAGILDATTFANINTNSSIGKGSVGGSASDLVLNGGILRHSAANAASTNRLFSVGTAGGRLQSTHGTAGNFMKFIGTGAMDFNGQTGARTLTLDGTNTGENTVALLIGDNSGATSISKTGAGTWLLTNANTYTGDTTVSAGTLVLDFTGGNDRIKNTNQVVLAGGTLQLRNLGTNTQTLATTSITAAGSRITQGTGYTSGVSDLGTLSASGLGTLDVSNLGVGTTWIKASGNASQSFLLDGRVTANSGAFLVKTDASGNLQTVATTDYVSDASIGDSPGTSVRLVSTGGTGGGSTGSGFIGLSTAGTTNFETLQNNYTTGTTTIDVNAGNILRLGTSGVITSSLGATLTIGTTTANGGVLTAGGADNTAGTLYFNHANNITVNSAINNNGTGVVSLTKVGAGTLTLGGTNSYSGGTIINSGNLTITADANLGDAASNLVFNGTSILTGNVTLARDVVVNSSGALSFGGDNATTGISSSYNLTGTGTVTLGKGANHTFAGTGNTFTGTIMVSTTSFSQALTVGSLGDGGQYFLGSPIGSGAGTLTFTGGAAPSTFNTRQFMLGGGSSKIVNNNTNAAHTVSINTDLGFSSTGTRSLTLGGTNTGANTFGGSITNNGASAVSLTKSDGGTWALSGTNTYSGKTTVGAGWTGPGTLIFQGKQAVSPNTTFETQQSSGATAKLVFLDDSAGVISLNNSWTFRSDGGPGTKNTHIFVGNNSTANGGNNPGSTQTGSTIALGGYTSFPNGGVNGNAIDKINITGANGYKLQLASIAFPDISTKPSPTSYTISLNPTTAPVIVTGGVTPFASTNLNSTPVINLDGTATGNEIQGAIADPSNVPTSNPLSLTKTNSSTWTLSGTNGYTGATTVSAGTLLVNGSLNVGSAVSVNAGTLGGTGTISGTVTIGNSSGSADAILAPGASSIESLATGNLTFNSDGSYAVELNASSVTTDVTNVNGTVSINAATTLTVNVAGTLSGSQQYVIVANNGANPVSGTFFNLAQGATVGTYGGSPLKISYIGGDGNDIVLYTDSTGASAYDTWKAANAPGSNPDDDTDGDGVPNAVEFVLGGDKDTNDLGKLPVPSTDGTNMTFTFKRKQSSIDPKTSLAIEVGTDLATWNTAPSPYTVPDGATAGPPVTVVKGVPAGYDTVTLTVAQDSAKKFARLKVVITP